MRVDSRSVLWLESQDLILDLLAPLHRAQASRDHRLGDHARNPSGEGCDRDPHRHFGCDGRAGSSNELGHPAAARLNSARGDGRCDQRIEPAMQLALQLYVEVIRHVQN